MLFNKPLLLLLFIPLALLIFLLSRGKRSQSQLIYSSVRCFVLALLVLALSGVSIIGGANGIATAALFDLSASSAHARDEYSNIISALSSQLETGDSLGVIAFSQNAAIESLPGGAISSGLLTEQNPSATNIAQALTLASAVLPEDSLRRVVLVSDGLENSGDALTLAQSLGAKGIVVDSYYIGPQTGAEVQLNSLKTAKYLSKNTRNDIELSVFSSARTMAEVTIYKNNEKIISQELELSEGNNELVFSDIADEGGGVIYRAEVYAASDSFMENNSATGYSYVEDIPKLLLIGHDKSADELAALLRGSKLDIDRINAVNAPARADSLSVYDGVILCDVSADDLPKGFMDAVKGYVENYGGGLLTTGGENSYALGAWLGTALAEILPVDMELKDKRYAANLGVAMVIDRSGSMSGGSYGISKLEMAKEALIRSAENFSENDTLGIVAFDDQAEWTVPLQNAAEKRDEIINRAASITLGGGTSILPALQMAYEGLVDTDAKIRHIILLTDGQAERTGYEALLAGMKKNEITLSTIAVGQDADISLLKSLAEKGGGRYYFTDEFSDLPKLFMKETQIAGKAYLNNYDFYPKAGYSEVLDGIAALPMLRGYVSTMLKPSSELVLSSDTDEPILALRQYGLGRTAAYTSSIGGLWSEELLAADEGTELIRNTISWLIKTHVEQNYSLEAVQTKNGIGLDFKTQFDPESPITDISGKAIAENGDEIPLAFHEKAPGVFSVDAAGLSAGSYLSVLEIERGGESSAVSLGFSIPYSQEYDLRQSESGRGQRLLSEISAATGGRMLSANDMTASALHAGLSYTDVSPYLLIASLCLFFADVAIRRFTVAEKIIRAIDTAKRTAPSGKRISQPVLEPKPTNTKEKKPLDSRSTSQELLVQMKKRKG